MDGKILDQQVDTECCGFCILNNAHLMKMWNCTGLSNLIGNTLGIDALARSPTIPDFIFFPNKTSCTFVEGKGSTHTGTTDDAERFHFATSRYCKVTLGCKETRPCLGDPGPPPPWNL